MPDENALRSATKTRWLALFAASAVICGCELNGGGTSVAAPNGKLRTTVEADDEGRLRYTVTKGGVTIIESSPLGLVSSTHDLTGGVTMRSGQSRAIDEAYTMLRWQTTGTPHRSLT